MSDLIFGLDIGTRTVIGTLGYIKEKKWHVKHHICMEHEERAMLDGQVHDIEKVANIVRRIKEKLEEEVGYALKEVNIAAAGRVLNTQMTYVTKSFDEVHEIGPLDMQNLQVEGIDLAKEMLERERKIKATEYFCVGHTVINYFVDDYVISNPEGHKGEVLSAKILATFLPKSVVDSLYAVTNRVDLHVSHLTLEPIAAINAVIPENLRLLNLALVDIGAGTSDIAITREGSVVAYGMIPMAGDEVTEAIVHKYLVDFNTAEKMKQAMNYQEIITYEDIIGFTNEISSTELKACIEPIMGQLAKQIGKKILELNGKKSTNAVFCIGGGSQMPGLIENLSSELKLPEARVAVRLADQIPDVVYECEMTKGPEMITPLGIAMTAAKSIQQQFLNVNFNGEKITLMNTKKMTILDVLMHAGIAHTEIFPTKGRTLMFKCNGERIRIKGGSGEAAVIFLNDQIASLEDAISEGDRIHMIFAKPGVDGTGYVKDYIHLLKEPITLYVNGEPIYLPMILVNGDMRSQEEIIQDGDEIEVKTIHTLLELCQLLQMKIEEKLIVVNGNEVNGEYLLQPFDHIDISNKVEEQKNNHMELLEQLLQQQNDSAIRLYVNGELIELPYKEAGYVFVNIFDYIDFDLSQPKGTIQLILNGMKAAVTDPIKENDKIEIYWKK
ncbi:cell division protein FtsA [Niameybacter massiliensis]|uniref:Cell division protein FtsA n=1 Tax=Holtiella tumoricola TaxID=3018743 RepID=A0AA42J2U0_9FIRM|nr:cell division protein FtsA [Holtiella tumoricola]MDA3733685.1 cell division protein FtsA [Holtiella tumoricola]